MNYRLPSHRPAGRDAVPPAALGGAFALHRASRAAGLLPALLLGLPALLPWLRRGATPWLEYDRQRIAGGEAWRIVTCHWTHWTADHLLWDLGVFVLLAALCWRLGRVRTAAALAASALLIPLALWRLEPGFDRYRGLSGLDSALFVLLAVALIRRERSTGRGGAVALLAGLLVAFAAKLAFEAVTGGTLFVDGSGAFVPVPLAHLAGGVCGAVAAALPRYRPRDASPEVR